MPSNIWAMVGLIFLLSACSQPLTVRPALPDATDQASDRRLLAGEWEYEDGGVVVLKLDEKGNGTYDWKEGQFFTASFSGHTWTGIWTQKENDREGGFQVLFSPEYTEGEGHWWYTRIGSDTAPTQQGGTFHLKRATNHADQVSIPLTP